MSSGSDLVPECRRPLSDEVTAGVAAALGWRFADVPEVAISCGTLRKLPLVTSLLWRCAPLGVWPGRAVVLVDDPLNGVLLEANPQLFGPPYRREIEVVLTRPEAIDAALQKRRRGVRD